MKIALRSCAVVLCVLLMVSAVPPVQATETVYFTAVNETVLKLSDTTMPFVQNGILYVSSEMFADKELGITYYHNVVTKAATLYNAVGALRFDLEKGTVTSADGRPMPVAAILRGSRVFFPVEMVAGYFGLDFTQSAVAHGLIVRLRSADSVLNNRLFLDAATSLLEYRYEEYQKSAVPDVPDVPDVIDPPDPPKPPVADKRTVCLGFRMAENSGHLLGVLTGAEEPATFFFTQEQIIQHPVFVRQLLVMGCGIGLVVDCAQHPGVAEQLRTANELLWRIAGTKTRLCVLDNAGTADVESARNGGYCPFYADVERGLPDDGAGDLYRTIHRQPGDAVTVWLDNHATEVGLLTFLRLAKDNGDRLAVLTEPVLEH